MPAMPRLAAASAQAVNVRRMVLRGLLMVLSAGWMRGGGGGSLDGQDALVGLVGLSTASRKALLSTAITLLPLFLNSCTRRASAARTSWPALSAASCITAPKTFLSSSESLAHSVPEQMVKSDSTMWPVSEMFFCTSKNFLASIVGSG